MGSGELTLVGSGKSMWSGESSGIWRVQRGLSGQIGSEESSGVWGVQWDLGSNFNEVLTNW